MNACERFVADRDTRYSTACFISSIEKLSRRGGGFLAELAQKRPNLLLVFPTFGLPIQLKSIEVSLLTVEFLFPRNESSGLSLDLFSAILNSATQLFLLMKEFIVLFGKLLSKRFHFVSPSGKFGVDFTIMLGELCSNLSKRSAERGGRQRPGKLRP